MRCVGQCFYFGCCKNKYENSELKTIFVRLTRSTFTGKTTLNEILENFSSLEKKTYKL